MTQSPVQPAAMAQPTGAYSLAVEVTCNRFAFISGQVALDARGELVGPGDVAAQSRQVFENLSAILETAGGGFANLVKLTVFLTDPAHFPAFAQVRKEYLSAPYPAASTVVVQALVDPAWLIEVEAVAAF